MDNKDTDADALIARAGRGEEIVLQCPGGRDGALGVFSLVMTAAALWLLLTGGLSGGGVWMGAASGLFFAGLAAFRLRLWLTPRLRQLRLTPDALEMPAAGAVHRLAWRAVENIRVVPHASVLPGRSGGKMILLDIAAENQPRAGLFGLGRRAGLHPDYGLAAEDMLNLLETCRRERAKGDD